jgi:hypothetical protein
MGKQIQLILSLLGPGAMEEPLLPPSMVSLLPLSMVSLLPHSMEPQQDITGHPQELEAHEAMELEEDPQAYHLASHKNCTLGSR